jgi:hypothetical protein
VQVEQLMLLYSESEAIDVVIKWVYFRDGPYGFCCQSS